jgi:hypothetical protein
MQRSTLSAVLLLFSAPCFAAEETPQRPLARPTPEQAAWQDNEIEYLHIRAGLPNCPHKFQPGTWINTIFVQGAATSGESGGNSNAAYHSEVIRVLRSTFPGSSGGAPVIAGGTGSWWAAFCAARGQAVYGQHLPAAVMFVDVATDDGDATEDRVCAALEGLVRQLWTTYPGTDLVFLYGLRKDDLDAYRAGRLPPASGSLATDPAHDAAAPGGRESEDRAVGR